VTSNKQKINLTIQSKKQFKSLELLASSAKIYWLEQSSSQSEPEFDCLIESDQKTVKV